MKVEINKDELVLLMASLDLFAHDDTGYVSDFYDDCMALYNRLLKTYEEGK